METSKKIDSISMTNTIPESRAEQSRAEQSRAEQSKDIVVLGGLGVSARRDRDPDRVLYRRGIVYALPAHISSDKPLVVRKIKKVVDSEQR